MSAVDDLLAQIQREQVVNRLGGTSGGPAAALGGGLAGNALVARLLPLLAPVVMSWLAKQVTGGGSSGAGTGRAAQPQGGGLADILGGLLGGGSGRGGQADALGGLLGGLLGGGRR